MKVYLVIVHTLLLGCSIIYAGEPIEIKNGSLQLFNPCGAYDWNNNQFVTAWEEHTTATEWRIYGQRLFDNGQLNGNQIVISSGDGGKRRDPAIAYDPHADRFLVVYVFNSTAIWGRFISSDGTMSSLMNIVSSSDQLDNPAVVYDPVLCQFLVAYEHLGEHTADYFYSQIFVQHVTSGGSKAGTPVRVSNTENIKPATEPAIASVGGHSVVLWQEEDVNDTYDIYGRVMRNGAIGSGVLPIATSDYTQHSPSITVNPGTQEYLIVWQTRSTSYYRSKIYIMTLKGNSVRKASYPIVSDSGYDLKYPAIGYDGSRNEYVVSWFAKEYLDASPLGQEKIQFRRVSSVSLSEVVTVDTAGGLFSGLSRPFVVFNDSDTFLLGYQIYSGLLTNMTYYIKGFIEEYCIDADINCDGDVNLIDLSIVSESWMID